MRRVHGWVSAFAVAVAGCGGGTINYDPAMNSDTTPPGVNLLVRRAGVPDVEVQGRVTPSPFKNTNFGNPIPDSALDFSVLATATDSGSGIASITLKVNRAVCFVTSNGDTSEARMATQTRKQASYTDPRNAPVQASLGETGLIDRTPGLGTVTDDNLLAFRNANQNLVLGIGVGTKWFMEATNFNGKTAFSDVIFVRAGDTSCITTPL